MQSFKSIAENGRFLQEFENCKFCTPAKFHSAYAKILSRLLSIIETSFIRQNYRNGHIYIKVMKQHIVLNAYFSRKLRKTNFMSIKIGFSRFSQKVSILKYMLLHKSNINVAIALAVTLMGRKSLYTLQELKYNYKP